MTQLSESGSGSQADALDANSEDIQLTSAVKQSDVRQAGLIRPRQLPAISKIVK